MNLFVGVLVTVAVGWGVVLASPSQPRRAAKNHADPGARAEHACHARGPDCKLVVKTGAPGDAGAACVCG
jgi:hypothetical protein